MAATCPTTEAALQTGLLPAQERRKRCFAKASAFFAKPNSAAFVPVGTGFEANRMAPKTGGWGGACLRCDSCVEAV